MASELGSSSRSSDYLVERKLGDGSPLTRRIGLRLFGRAWVALTLVAPFLAACSTTSDSTPATTDSPAAVVTTTGTSTPEASRIVNAEIDSAEIGVIHKDYFEERRSENEVSVSIFSKISSSCETFHDAGIVSRPYTPVQILVTHEVISGSSSDCKPTRELHQSQVELGTNIPYQDLQVDVNGYTAVFTLR